MLYAVCCVPVAPIRIAPDHKTEMVSQLLFGECCCINDTDKKDWLKIICKADGYEGWCQSAHLDEIDINQYNYNDVLLAADWINEINYKGNTMFISFGSLIATNGKSTGVIDSGLIENKFWRPTNANKTAETIQQIAFKFLNTAYLWGGRSVFGIDCSGFAQAVYKFLNIPLLRDAKLQALHGEVVNFLQEARCGDLAFFDDETGEIIHVGILLNEKEIIHASGKVRIDKIDNEGIVNTDTGERTHRLRIIKRYF
jgi:cell wall-associated NlpC family hydrolase